MTLNSTTVCAAVSDAGANYVSRPLWLLQYVSSDLWSSSANLRSREQSQPVIEAALVWVKKKNRLLCSPCRIFSANPTHSWNSTDKRRLDGNWLTGRRCGRSVLVLTICLGVDE